MESVLNVLNALPWFAWIAIVAILGGVVRGVQTSRHQHLERMERIAQGFDPALGPGSDEDDEDYDDRA